MQQRLICPPAQTSCTSSPSRMLVSLYHTICLKQLIIAHYNITTREKTIQSILSIAYSCVCTMETHVKLPNGTMMPVRALGTWRADQALLPAAIDAALAAGVRHFDTAAMYGNEKVLGASLAASAAAQGVKREELFLATKLMPTDCHAEHVEAALAKSLTQLGVEYLDLYMLHWPYRFAHNPSSFPVPVHERLGYRHADLLVVWRLLEAAVDAGKIKSLGVSNFTRPQLARLLADARHRPVVNQLEVHAALQQAEVAQWHAAHGVVVTAYCPLGSPARPANMRTPEDPPDALTDAAVMGIASRLGVTPAQVLLRWHLQRGVVPLPKSTTPHRIATNADILRPELQLSDADMAAIQALDRGYRLCRGEQYAVEGQTWQDLWREE